MRGNQEAFILVEMKDGRQYVCALNRSKGVTDGSDRPAKDSKGVDLTKDVLWH